MVEPYVKHEFLFNDFDEYAKFIRQADIEQSQLSQGSFKGKFKSVGSWTDHYESPSNESKDLATRCCHERLYYIFNTWKYAAGFHMEKK